MHKQIMKFFEFLKNCVQFIKLLIILLTMFFLIYWAEMLIGTNWAWLDIFDPFFNSLIRLSNYVLPYFNLPVDYGRIYAYALSLLILFGFYFITNGLFAIAEFFESRYLGLRKCVRKMEEDRFNKSIEKRHSDEMHKIKRFVIYVSASIKKRHSYQGSNIDLDEQYEIMNKFLSEKTGIKPTNFENGFLYSFDNFDQIDKVLPYFFKLIKSKAPLDYIICVQIIDSVLEKMDQLKTIADLKFENKIVMASDTAYRYKFNDKCSYETSQLGIYQKQGGTYELVEFVEK